MIRIIDLVFVMAVFTVFAVAPSTQPVEKAGAAQKLILEDSYPGELARLARGALKSIRL